MIQHVMANTTSAKKAIRQSKKKREHNLYWKRRVKEVLKNMTAQLTDKTVSIDIIKEQQKTLYKVVDKAAKEKAIHKNKANRIKSSISRKVSAHDRGTKTAKPVRKPTRKSNTKSAAAATKSQ